jgi:hypothetical protein
MQLRDQFKETRDTQWRRAYAAERRLPEWTSAGLGGESAIRARVRAVLNSKRVAKAFPFMRAVGARDITVTFVNRRWCRGGVFGLEFTHAADETELLVLHEMAHLIHQREMHIGGMRPHIAIPYDWRHRKGYSAGHGWRWAMIYLQLVRWFMGGEVAKRLKVAFKVERVRHHAPRVMSPAARAAAAERLRKARTNAEFWRQHNQRLAA